MCFQQRNFFIVLNTLILRTVLFPSELIPAYQYLLEWHYNFLQFDKLGGHSIIRQHAAALISLIGCKLFGCTNESFAHKLNQCISKWFYTATQQTIQDVSKNEEIFDAVSYFFELLCEFFFVSSLKSSYYPHHLSVCLVYKDTTTLILSSSTSVLF